MQLRIALGVAIVLTAIGALLVWKKPVEKPPAAAQTAPTPAPPRAPMLSSAFMAAVKDVLSMENTDALKLEQRLAANPSDAESRAKLMAYWLRADQAGKPELEAKRWRQALWLIEHEPDSEILHSYVARFVATQHTEAEIRQAERLWESAVRSKAGDAGRLWNAACFFDGLEPNLRLSYLEATAEADPNHPQALLQLAQLYASALLTPTNPLASRAKSGLERSRNVWVLGNAANLLQLHYNQTMMMRLPDSRLAELAERYFAKAQAIDPKLAREKILPQYNPGPSPSEREASALKEQEHFAKAAKEIRRLPLDAFPQLPAIVARVLRVRKCTVPQPEASGTKNVIQGEFIARGEKGWAVVCSANGSATLLVFQNDADDTPQTLNTGDDAGYLQGMDGDKIEYSREIRAVDRETILANYRAYGGPAPPPIDHQAIEDAFIGKASSILYFHRGKWLQLQGAD